MSLLLNSVTAPAEWDVDPRSIPNCDIWFDAADTRTITGTSPVTAWLNKGNISMSAVNDVGTCTSGAGTINGRNFISCPQGTNLAFTCALTSQARSVFLVVRGQQQLTTQAFAPLTRGTASTTQMAIALSRASSTAYHYNINLSAGVTTRINAQSTYQTTPGVYYRVVSPVPNMFNTTTVYGFVNATTATSANFITVNGCEYRSGTVPTSVSPNTLASGYDTTSVKYSINTSDTSASFNTGMDICEIIYYNRQLTMAERKSIEGYLGWKWGVAKSLSPSLPLSVPNCLAWFDADVDFNDATSRATSFTFSSGDNVQTWIDKSGNGNTATSSTTGKGLLTVNAAGGNGKCGVSFGAGSTISLTSTLSLGTSQSFTLFLVANSATFLTQRAACTVNGYPGTAGGYVSLQQTAVSPPPWLWTGGTGFEGVTTGVPLGSSRTDVVSAVWSPGSCQYTTNGLRQETSSTTPTALTANSQFLIGGFATGTTISNSWAGPIFEILVYDGVLSEGDRIAVESYLSNKWNLTNYIGRIIKYHPSRFWKPFNRQYIPYDMTTRLPEVWFDGADLSTITGTSQVTNWVNKGTLGGSATNRTGSCTSGNTFNGLNYISIPAGTDLGFVTALPNLGLSCFVVARVNTVLASGQAFAILERTTSTTQRTVRGIYSGATTTRFGAGSDAVSNVTFFLSADATSSLLNSAFLGSLRINNIVAVNGTDLTLIASSIPNVDTTTLTYTLGRSGYNTSIDLMELILTSQTVFDNERLQLEGYLAWKWGLQSLLPSPHSYSAVRIPPNVAKMSPLQVTWASAAPTPVIFWLDAYDPYGTGILPTSGVGIQAWSDKSGYSRTVYQNTVSQRPVFTFDGIYPAVQFTGSSSQFLQSLESLLVGVQYTGYSIYVVCKPMSLASDNTVLFHARNALSNTEANSIHMQVLGSVSGNNGFKVRYNSTTTKRASAAGTTDRMLLCITDTGNSTTTIPCFFKNGTGLTTTLTGVTGLNILDAGRVVVGAQCFSSTFGSFFTGLIYEIVIIREYYATKDREYMEGYLAWKWGLQTSLPATHPFYEVSP